MARNRFFIIIKVRVKLRRADRENRITYINYIFHQTIRALLTKSTIIVKFLIDPTFDRRIARQRSKIAVIIYLRKWW